MTADPIESLTALDWPITTMACQCLAYECHNTALFVVETHATDDCNGDDLNPFGNHVVLLCGLCLAVLRVHIANRVAATVRAARGPVSCLTCGAPVAEPGDVLRAVTAL